MTLRRSESSSAEFGRRGLDPSHFNIVPSSSGRGWKVNVDVTSLPFVKKVNWIIEEKNILFLWNLIV